MDDVSTDDELANLPTILPNMTPRMGKSVSLPVMDESQESRLERTSQWAQSQFSFGHPFSETDMSPVARLERVCSHEPWKLSSQTSKTWVSLTKWLTIKIINIKLIGVSIRAYEVSS